MEILSDSVRISLHLMMFASALRYYAIQATFSKRNR